MGSPRKLFASFMAELTPFSILAEPCGAEIVAELGLVVGIEVLLIADLHATVSKCTLHTTHRTASLKGHWPVVLQ